MYLRDKIVTFYVHVELGTCWLARLCGPISPVLGLQVCTATPACLPWGWRSLDLRSSCLHGKDSTSWVLSSTQALNPDEEGMVSVFQRIDGRNSIRVAIMIGGGDTKSPVNWMSVTHRAIIEDMDKSLKQVFQAHTRCMCGVCLSCLCYPHSFTEVLRTRGR